MKRIWQKRKLILTLGVVVFLIFAFFIGKSIPVAYGASVGGLIFAPDGYFMADNSVFGGPGDGWYNSGLGSHGNNYGSTNLTTNLGCGNCLAGYWYRYKSGRCCHTCCSGSGKSRKCRTCNCHDVYQNDWICTLKLTGIQGKFTADSACKAAYGGGVSARVTYIRNTNTQINICDFTASKVYMVECTAPPASTPVVLPPPIPAACLELKDGVCIKVGTSIFQGGDKGDILTEPAQLITRIFTIILGFAGGIALLLIIFAGYKIIMSKGKPEAIQQGREQLTSAIVGLVFIIFSFVIFQLVFVDILKIPGII